MRSFTLRRVVPLAVLALGGLAASAVPAEPAAPALVAHDAEAPGEDADLHYASEVTVGEALPPAASVDGEDQCDASASDSRSAIAPTAFARCDDSDEGGPAATSPALVHGGLAPTSAFRSPLCETVEVQGCPHWEARYEAEWLSGGTAVAVSPDGRSVIVTGSSYINRDPLPSGLPDMSSYALTVAYDADTGAQQWSRKWRPGLDANTFGLALAVTPDSSLVLVAAEVVVTSVTDERTAILAYDAATGDLEWSAWVNDSDPGAERDIMGGTFKQPPSPKQLTIAPDGRTVFLGFNSANPSREPSAGWNMVTVALDTASGDERWLNRYDGPLQSEAAVDAVLPDPDGAHVYSVGETATLDGVRQVVLKIDAATGDAVEEWLVAAHPDGESDTRDAALAGGRLVIAGVTTVAGQVGIGTVALDTATGTVQARAFTENPPDHLLFPVRAFASPDGDTALVAGGWVNPGETPDGDVFDFFAAAYDTSDGEQRWLVRLDAGTPVLEGRQKYLRDAAPWEILKGAALSPDGAHLALTGWSRVLGWYCTPVACKGKHPAYLTVALDTQDGRLLWLHRHAATHAGLEVSQNEAYGVAIGPDGTTYVTGTFARYYEEPGATWDSIYGAATLAYPRALDVLP